MEKIAIVGLGCRFPGAPNPQAFWQLMCRGGDAISEVPSNRFDVDALYDPRPATRGKVMSRWGGFLEDVDKFDASFFGISPKEASRMDPQHRLLLEVAWEAMEDAGAVPEKMTDAIAGVFIGLITSDYWDRLSHNAVELDVYATTGSIRSGAAGRISYALGLQGISVALDAACSSSLVAIHLACQSLRSGSCNLALAGGVSLILNPDHTIGFSQGKMMAPDGYCKSFDSRADGYVRSEGVGIVVLKPLSQALADGDVIYAVIRGSAANNDGHSDLFMTPSIQGQQAVLRQAYRDAEIAPALVQYVEAHGTGTSVGDPVELTALGRVLAEKRPADHPCFVGSVKTNIGHAEGAAGLAGIIKVALSLKYKLIPPNLHFQEPNPAIPWQELPLVVPQQLTPWPQWDGPRLAGVSSFGIAGTNVHVVLEEAPTVLLPSVALPIDAFRSQLLTLSAHSYEALTALARSYQTFLIADHSSSLQDVCYSASVRRTQHDHRLAITSHSFADAHQKVSAFLLNQSTAGVVSGRRIAGHTSKIAWIFPGQGSQWLGMGCELLRQEPVFRSAIEQCEKAMHLYIDWSLVEQLQANESHSRFEQIDVVQPALFAVQVALAALWRSWGIEPDAIVGHSMGEIAAAYVAGALSLEDAALVICIRSQLLLRTSGKGTMAAVELTPKEAQLVIADYADRVSIAVCNSPNSTVLSGEELALAEILKSLEQQGIFGRLVKVNVAAHSPQMDPLQNDILKLLASVRPRKGTIAIYSTVTGNVSYGEDFDVNYWVKNLREPVLFTNAIQQLLHQRFDIFLEISPHPVLVGALKKCLQYADLSGTVLGSTRRNEAERALMLESLGTLYVQGCSVNWQNVSPANSQFVPLPLYPWQRERFWYEPRGKTAWQRSSLNGGTSSTHHPMLDQSVQSALHPEIHFWQTMLNLQLFPYLTDHRVHGMVVLPGTGYVELALAAATEVFGVGQYRVEHLTLQKTLFFAEEDTTHTIQVVLTSLSDESAHLQIFSLQAECDEQSRWLLHAHARLQRQACIEPSAPIPLSAIADLQCAGTQTMLATEHYQTLARRGIEHGPLFQGIIQIWHSSNQALAAIAIPEELAPELSIYHAHPALLDVCLQVSMSFLPDDSDGDTYVVAALSSVRLYRSLTPVGKLWSYAVVQPEGLDNPDEILTDVFVFDEQQQLFVEVLGLRLQRLERSTPQAIEQRLNELLYTVEWEPVPLVISELSPRLLPEQTWLIFSDAEGKGQRLAVELEHSGARPILVLPGETYRCISRTMYYLPPTSAEAFQCLLKDLFADSGYRCDGIVYLWGAQESQPAPPTLSTLHSDLQMGCVGALHLVQALMTLPWELLPRLWLVTCGAQAVIDGDQLPALSQSSLWGLGRVIVYEHSDLRCTLIDVNEAGDWLALHKEICSNAQEDEIALRHNQRYLPRLQHFTPAQVLTSLTDANHTLLDTLFHAEYSYLITGGLGGVGLKVAQWMVAQGARYLALMGRSGASEAAEETVQALRASGVVVQVVEADVSQEQQVAAALASIRQTMPPLRGVIHSAVILDDSILLQSNQERFLTVMSPKLDGAWNLHTLTLHDKLDFFILFSSAASIIGSPGQGNYAAANAFMDALAHYRRALGYPALSINWGRWAEVGQATLHNRGDRLDVRGFASMKPQEGLVALERLMRQNTPQVGVMPFNFKKWSQFYPRLRNSTLFARLEYKDLYSQPKENSSLLSREKLVTMDAEEVHQSIMIYLSEQIARVLGLSSSKIDAYQQLNRLGIDSLMAVELRNRISSDLLIDIPIAKLLQGATLEQLTLLIIEQGDNVPIVL